jgi:hypothetical protein
MPHSPRILIALVLLIALIAAGCGEEDSASDETQLDREAPGSMPLPGTTQAPLPTETPAPAATLAANVTPLPSATPYPTPGEDAATGPFPQVVVPNGWRYQPFTIMDGTQHTLSEFQGRTVVIHTLATLCEQCAEQQNNVMAAVAELYDTGQLGDAVIMALGVEPQETPTLLRNVLRDQLEERATTSQQEGPQSDSDIIEYGWSVVDTLNEDENPAEWMAAVASEGLLSALSNDFGTTTADPTALTIIVIAPDGLAHVTSGGLINKDTLVEAIQVYGGRSGTAGDD